MFLVSICSIFRGILKLKNWSKICLRNGEGGARLNHPPPLSIVLKIFFINNPTLTSSPGLRMSGGLSFHHSSLFLTRTPTREGVPSSYWGLAVWWSSAHPTSVSIKRPHQVREAQAQQTQVTSLQAPSTPTVSLPWRLMAPVEDDGRVFWWMKQNIRPWNIIILITLTWKSTAPKDGYLKNDE